MFYFLKPDKGLTRGFNRSLGGGGLTDVCLFGRMLPGAETGY